jgi:exosortase A
VLFGSAILRPRPGIPVLLSERYLKVEREAILAINRPPAPALSKATRWLVLGLTLAGIIWLLGWYAETVLSIVTIWERSSTYAHGFLIFPISAYLIWARRSELLAIAPKPDFSGLAVLAGLGFMWLLGGLAVAPVVQQYALVMMIPTLVWVVLGRGVVTALFFPLLFLLFAVPVGDFLLPPLMNFTADFTVAALRLTGIPVFREGNFFTVPSGNWSVVEACSGLRYLIASLTLGCLYAYLTYRSIRRRLVFIGLSILVPILANGFRAYMIVMIGHLSNMRLATGIDHYIYGWVFFGVVMLLLFWIGSFWRQDRIQPKPLDDLSATPKPDSPRVVSPVLIAGATAVVALVAAVWPSYSNWIDTRSGKPMLAKLGAPSTTGGWISLPEELTGWTPRYFGAQSEVHQTYGKDGKQIGVFIKYYRNQNFGSRLISSTNVVVSSNDAVWGKIGEQQRRIVLDTGPLTVRETTLRSSGARLLVWDWYWIDGSQTADHYYGKWLQAQSKLLGRSGEGAAVFIYAPFEENPDTARATLADFANSNGASIAKLLESMGK